MPRKIALGFTQSASRRRPGDRRRPMTWTPSAESMSRVARTLLSLVWIGLIACGFSTPPPAAAAIPTSTPAPAPTPPHTVQERVEISEFAERCAAITATIPLSLIAHGSRNEFVAYLSDEWRQLGPPTSLETYHVAVQAMYDEWTSLPEDVDIDPNSPVLQGLLEATVELDRYTLDVLEAKQCIDR